MTDASVGKGHGLRPHAVIEVPWTYRVEQNMDQHLVYGLICVRKYQFARNKTSQLIPHSPPID